MNHLSFSISTDPIMITNQEIQQFQTYAHDHLISKAKRIIAFLTSQEFAPTAAEIEKSSQECGYNGIVMGVKTVSVASALGAYANYKLKTDVVDGMVKGAIMAVSITVVKNSLDFSLELSQSLSRAPSYSEWLEKAKMRDAFPVYQKILINTPELNGYVCPLSLDWIQDPVSAPDGQIYERVYIVDWVRRKETELHKAVDSELWHLVPEIKATFSPIRGKFFQEKDLVPVVRNYETIRQDAKKYINTLEDEQVKLLFNEALHYLEEVYTKNQSQQKALIHVSEKIQEFVRKMDLPQSVYDSTVTQLNKRARTVPV